MSRKIRRAPRKNLRKSMRHTRFSATRIVARNMTSWVRIGKMVPAFSRRRDGSKVERKGPRIQKKHLNSCLREQHSPTPPNSSPEGAAVSTVLTDLARSRNTPVAKQDFLAAA